MMSPFPLAADEEVSVRYEAHLENLDWVLTSCFKFSVILCLNAIYMYILRVFQLIENIQEDLNGSFANFDFLSTGSHSAGVGVSLQMALNRSESVKVTLLILMYRRCTYTCTEVCKMQVHVPQSSFLEPHKYRAGEWRNPSSATRLLPSELSVWNRTRQRNSWIVHNWRNRLRSVAWTAGLPQNPHRNCCMYSLHNFRATGNTWISVVITQYHLVL